jgi:hypothetical protein
MAYRFFDPNTQYRDDDGVICASGSLTFTITGTTTAKNVYAESSLTTSLGNVIDLDASGRADQDFWLATDAQYRVVLKDGDGVEVWTRDEIRDVDSTVTVQVPDPASGTDGQALFTDGTDFYFDDVSQVPSMSGHSGKYLTNDGTLASWAALPTYSETSLPGGITDASSSLQIGKRKFQWGSDSAASSGTTTTNKAVTFGEAYSTAPTVFITITGSTGSTPQGAFPSHGVVATTTGFTVYFYANDEHDSPGWTITSSVPFNWIAIGTVT